VPGIRFTPPGTLTTLPALANLTAAGGLISHLASGAGWETTFVLVNSGANMAQASLSFLRITGSRFHYLSHFPRQPAEL
jgi:hypothetical protein